MKGGFKSQNGQAIVEMAFVMMAFLFTIFGVTEFSRALYTYNTIVQSTRAAARWAVVNGNGTTIDATGTQNMVVYGSPASSGTPVLPGLTTSMVNVSVQAIEVDSNGLAINQKVSVSVSGYQFRFLVPFVPNIAIPAFETSLYTESLGATG